MQDAGVSPLRYIGRSRASSSSTPLRSVTAVIRALPARTIARTIVPCNMAARDYPPDGLCPPPFLTRAGGFVQNGSYGYAKNKSTPTFL